VLDVADDLNLIQNIKH